MFNLNVRDSLSKNPSQLSQSIDAYFREVPLF